MSTQLTTSAPTATVAHTDATAEPLAAPRVTQRSLARAEWIKFRSVRSNVVALLAAGAATVVFGTIFSSLAGSDDALPPGATAGTDSLSMSFGGMNLSQLVLGILGAVFVAGEYQTGMIRSMFVAAGGRIRVLRAKALVLGAGTWVVMTAASFVVFFTGRAVYAGDGATYGLGDDGVLRAVLGGGLYGTAIVLMGVALGFLVRSTAGAIGTLVGTLMILPALVDLMPEAVGESVGKFLPSNAGQAITSVAGSDTLLSPAAGLAVLVLWVVGLLGVAAVRLQRRDA